MTAVFAQRQATVSGVIRFEDGELPQGTRVAIHQLDTNNAWAYEVESTSTLAGTFSITTDEPSSEVLRPFTSGAFPIPGFHTDYQVSPDGVNVARALTNVYTDVSGSGVFDMGEDIAYPGVLSLEDPVGFFVLLYVDQDATVTGRGVELSLAHGWNVFTVRFPSDGDAVYAVESSVNDALLDIFAPQSD